MSPNSLWMSLPREMRNVIYYHYLFEEEGYHYNYETKKFRASNSRPIDLALTYTYTSIASEMRGLALKINTLIFSTVYSEAERLKAGRYHWLLASFVDRMNGALGLAQDLVTAEVKDTVAAEYPQFKQAFDERTYFASSLWRLQERCWGEPRSVFYDGFVNYTLKLLLEHEETELLHAVRFVIKQDPSFLARLLELKLAPWAILSEDQVTELSELITISNRLFWDDKEANFWKDIKHRFSATAVAINWFQSTSQSTLRQARKILLNEDRESIGFPECHAAGLVEYCKENPWLHVERRVNIWENVLPSGADHSLNIHPLCRIVYHSSYLALADGADQIQSKEVSNSFSAWIEEAFALFDAGMPTNSFTLVFAGDPSPDQSSQVFEILKRDAVWQDAFDEWCRRCSLSLSFEERRQHPCYHSERFPKLLKT